MHSTARAVIEETFTASHEGTIHFGQVIGRLMEAGVEAYAVDYRSHRTVYYLANDDTLSLAMPVVDEPVARVFSSTGVQAAIRAAQQGTVMYPAFKRLSMQAGCVGYTVWIAGRHVVYFGRQGETHVERFPD